MSKTNKKNIKFLTNQWFVPDPKSKESSADHRIIGAATSTATTINKTIIHPSRDVGTNHRPYTLGANRYFFESLDITL